MIFIDKIYGGSSYYFTAETNENINEQEDFYMIDLRPVNQFMKKNVIT